jgi:putative endonuclease
MPKVFTSEKQKIGEAGEDIACEFLMKQGFSISERNYTKKLGEIDIIGNKEGRLYFFEVKSTSVSGEKNLDGYRPEDNMHPWKIKRLSRTIQTYLLERSVSDNMDWQFDVLVVFLNLEKRTAKVRRIENVIL